MCVCVCIVYDEHNHIVKYMLSDTYRCCVTSLLPQLSIHEETDNSISSIFRSLFKGEGRRRCSAF